MNPIRLVKRYFAEKRHAERAKSLSVYDDDEQLFTAFYNDRIWTGGKGETVSGTGSTLTYTQKIRAALPELFQRRCIRRVFDAPCGDFNWFRHVERPEVSYVGGDIVADLVEQNRQQFADDSTSFMHFDITSDSPPESDLWICRDVLFHFSFDRIFAFMENFARSNTPLLLATTHHKCKDNIDIPTGSGRPLNLELAPIHLPAPLERLDDAPFGRRPRSMGLWTRAQVVEAISTRRAA